MLIEKNIVRKIEYYLKNYNGIKADLDDYENSREDILLASPAPADGMPRGNGTGDSTQAKAVRLEKLEESKRWVDIIGDALLKFDGSGKDRFIRMKYFEGQTTQKISLELFIDRTTVFDWRNEIIYYIALLAASRNLIAV